MKPIVKTLDWFERKFYHEYTIRGEVKRRVNDEMLPGDIILRSNDRYLTSRLVPGSYSHVGIYVGNNRVIHSVGYYGVRREDVLDYLRCDKFIVLRMFARNDEQMQEVCKRATDQLGKGYDYDFDFKDSGRYSCIELVYYCYKGIVDMKRRRKGLYKGRAIPDDLLKNEMLQVVKRIW
jgi:uncharacterized protein YycO